MRRRSVSLEEQREVLSGETAEDFLSGIFNKKLASVLLKAAKIQTDKKAGLLTSEAGTSGCHDPGI